MTFASAGTAQSFLSKRTKNGLSIVREQLSQYGLNPADWTVEQSHRANVVRLQNRNDFSFKMKARLIRSHKGELAISQLSITSI